MMSASIPDDASGASARRILAVLGAIFGGLLILLSLCGGLAYLIVPLRSAGQALANNTLLASATTIAFVYGALILFVALLVLNNWKISRFRFPPGWLFIVLFILVVSIGQAILTMNLAPAYLFPPWHILASAALPLAVLGYASRRLTSASTPSVLAEFVWGGLGTVLPAVVVELFVGVALALVVFIVLAVVLGTQGVQELMTRVQPLLRGGGNPDSVMSYLQQQPALLVIVGGAVVLFLSGAVPIVEELLKSLGPAVAIARTKPALTRALMWGLAAGAGYAFSENLLNGAGGASADAGTACLWAPVMLLRGGTSLMHIATTATITVGWYSVWVLRYRARFLLFLLAGLAGHGFWNLIAIGLGGALTQQNLCGRAATVGAGTNWGIALVTFLTLGLLILAAGGWIVWLVRWAGRHPEPAS